MSSEQLWTSFPERTMFVQILAMLSKARYVTTMWPAPRLLDSSVSRALHQYRRGQRFESCSGLKMFFRLWFHNCKLCVSLRWSTYNSYLYLQFRNMVFHIYIDIIHFLRVYYELTLWPAPRWLDSSVGRALHPYRRGHRFESRSGLKIFFRLWFHNCLSCVYNCDDQLKILKARYVRYEIKLLGDVAHMVDILAMYTVCDAGLLRKQGWITSGHERELIGRTGMNSLGIHVYL